VSGRTNSQDSQRSAIIDIYTIDNSNDAANMVGIKSLSDASLEMFQNASITNIGSPERLTVKSIVDRRKERSRLQKFAHQFKNKHRNLDLSHHFRSRAKVQSVLRPDPTALSRLTPQRTSTKHNSRVVSRMKNASVIGKNIN
jgi:hypothetical protein